MPLMKGWITWVGAAGLLLMGISALMDGKTDQGFAYISNAIGLVGLGRKIEKK